MAPIIVEYNEEFNYENLKDNAKRTIQGLKGIEAINTQLRLNFRMQIAALEQKFIEQCAPLYEHRKKVIAGEEIVTEQEIAIGEKESQRQFEDYVPLKPSRHGIALVKLNGFWLQALLSQPECYDLVQESDMDALRYLVDLSLLCPSPFYPNSPTAFTIRFTFAPNPFFKNKTLEKTYTYRDELGFHEEFLNGHVRGTRIVWKPGKNLIKVAQDAARNKGHETEDDEEDDGESFFAFFEPSGMITVPEEEAVYNEENDEDDRDYLLAAEFEIGETLRDLVIPKATAYFLGEAEDYNDYEDSDEDADSDDDSDPDNS